MEMEREELHSQLFLNTVNHQIAGGAGDGLEQAFLVIEAGQGRGLLIIGVKSVANGLFSLVGPLDNGAAAFVADPFNLGGHALDIVDGLAVWVLAGTAGAETIKDDIAGHINIDGHIQLDAQLF